MLPDDPKIQGELDPSASPFPRWLIALVCLIVGFALGVAYATGWRASLEYVLHVFTL